MKKKILIINHEFPPLGGGGGVAAKSLAEGFIANGFAVDYLTSGFNDKLAYWEEFNNIKIYRVRTFGRKETAIATNLSMISFLFFGFWKGIQLCLMNRYSFINTHFVLPNGILGFLLGKIFRIKNILSIHGGDIFDPSLKRSPHRSLFWKFWVRFLINQSEQTVANSTDIKKKAIYFYHPSKKIKIIPLPYHSFSFSVLSREELGLKKDDFYLITVGRLVKRKGFDFLLKALKLLDKEKIKLLLIGSGPEKDKLINLAKELKVTNRIYFLGNLEEERKFQYLQVADVFVLSSLHEGFGIVLQEAMQVGLPIIATNSGGQVDLIIDGENGFLIKPCDPQALAEKIEILWQNEVIRKKISKKNKQKIKEFDFIKIAKHYLEVIGF